MKRIAPIPRNISTMGIGSLAHYACDSARVVCTQIMTFFEENISQMISLKHAFRTKEYPKVFNLGAVVMPLRPFSKRLFDYGSLRNGRLFKLSLSPYQLLMIGVSSIALAIPAREMIVSL
jgi:hypothetical protein